MNNFSAIGPFQYAGIALAGILLTVLVLFLLLREQKSIKAIDGTRFSSEEACRAYEAVFNRINNLYSDSEKDSSNLNQGFQPGFLKLLKKTGFSDVKILLNYREDFRKLIELFDEESVE